MSRPDKKPQSSPRILIVEDQLIVAEDIATRLRRLGYDVAGQTDRFDDAVRLAETLAPDLVLMDIRLKDGDDGIRAADEIRVRTGVAVVYLTAHADDATLERAKYTQPFGYILKPFEERELRTAIEMALYKSQAERRLAESEHRFATTLASIGDAVIATDGTGAITFMNPVAEQLTRWPLADAMGKPLVEVFRIVNEYTRMTVENPVARVVRTGKVVGLANHTVLIARDGSECPIDDCASPISDGIHAMSGVVLVFRDVTCDRIRDEALHQAQKMEAVGQLAGGIAHDFNNFLTVIRMNCSILQESLEQDEPRRELIEQISLATDRAADLTRQMLAFGRKQLLRPKPVDICHVVFESRTLLQRLLPESVSLVVDPPPGPLATCADPGQVEQVLFNLVTNARDAMPSGGQIRISLAHGNNEPGMLPHFPGGPHVLLAVADNGTGMDAETMLRIWEPFFTTKTLGRGNGLGLATVYAIVKQSGGHISAQSAPGKGTTMHVTFPLTMDIPQAHGPAPDAVESVQGDETLLVVEDDPAVRHIIVQVLNSCGYKILEASHGAEAIDIAERYSGPIHLLLTDVLMPRMDGRTLARLLAARRPEVSTVFVTGYTGDENRANSGDFGKSAWYFEKPFKPSTLTRFIRNVLDGKHDALMKTRQADGS
jgi:two-component system, cell cycle sensor histidine kinase and response regulator CckA